MTKSIHSALTHCGFCGTAHKSADNCPDSAFAFFKCTCGQLQQLPRDCLFAMDGMVCACDALAAESWTGMSADDYRAASALCGDKP